MNSIFTIKLDVYDVKDFVAAAYSTENEIILNQGRTTTSGNSIMGIYSLDLSKKINMIVHDLNNSSKFFLKFGKWIIKESEELNENNRK